MKAGTLGHSRKCGHITINCSNVTISIMVTTITWSSIIYVKKFWDIVKAYVTVPGKRARIVHFFQNRVIATAVKSRL